MTTRDPLSSIWWMAFAKRLVLLAALTGLGACSDERPSSDAGSGLDMGALDTSEDGASLDTGGAPDASIDSTTGDGSTECECPCAGDRCVDGECTPADVTVDVAASPVETCAVLASGRAVCWAGGSIDESRELPGEVRAVGAGRLSLFYIDTDGRLFEWHEDSRSVPEASGSREWVDVHGGRDHECALATGGIVRCRGWGVAVGGGFTDERAESFVQVNPTGFDQLAVGNGWHSCGRLGTTVWCWGQNESGEIGIGDLSFDANAREVAGDWQDLAVGKTHTCALDLDGWAWCWGRNFYGTLGNEGGTSDDLLLPARADVPGGGWTRIFSNENDVCVVDDEGRRGCWGQNDDGALGLGSADGNLPFTRPTSAEPRWAQIELARNSGCGISRAGALYCWGRERGGLLGEDAVSPQRICVE